MPLTLPDGKPLVNTANFLEALLNDHILQQNVQAFLATRGAPISNTLRTCCVLQGEQAVLDTHACCTSNSSSIFIGSIEATTCVCVVLLCPATGFAWAAHYDEGTASSDQSLQQLCASRCFELPLDTYLLGAFQEDSGASKRVCTSVLDILHAKCGDTNFRVVLACLGAANSDPSTGGPLARDLAVNCTTGQAFSGGFQDRGPEVPRRSACCNVGGIRQLQPVWDTEHGVFMLSECPPRQLRLWERVWPQLKQCLTLTDTDLLSQNSTSPEHESERFCADMRRSYAWIQAAVAGSVDSDAVRFGWVEKGDSQEAGWLKLAVQME